MGIVFYVGLSDCPIVYLSTFCVEIESNLEDAAFVGGERGCVAFVLNLLESDGGGLVLLQFHDVDVVGRLNENVHAAVGCMPFDIDIYARCSVVLCVLLD